VEEHAQVAAAWFAELGLDRAFTGLVRETSRGAEAAAFALLLKLMIRWQGLFVDRDRGKARADFTLLFADHAVREFLGVHTYRESEWFVKERFELLMERLLDAAGICRGAAGDSEEPGSDAALLRKELHTLAAKAAEAGYRVDRFLFLQKMM